MGSCQNHAFIGIICGPYSCDTSIVHKYNNVKLRIHKKIVLTFDDFKTHEMDKTKKMRAWLTYSHLISCRVLSEDFG